MAVASPKNLNTTPQPSWIPRYSLAQTSLFLGLALLVSFGPVLLGQKTFFYRDYGVMGYPTMVFLADAIASGQFPLWNPYSNMGAPYLAQWGTMVCYPPSYLMALLPQPWGLNLFCLVHLWMGAVGAFLLCRRLVFARWPSAFAAFAFLYSGVTLASLTWPNYTVALAWLPWTALFGLDFLRRAGSRRLAKAALVAFLQLMSGAPEIILMTWALLASLAALVCLRKTRLPVLLGRVTLLGMVIAGLSAIQLLPFFEMLGLSQRGATSGTGLWSLPGYGWANFLLPMFHAFQTPEGTHFQYGQEFLSSTYLGGAQLLLACLACLFVRWVRPLGLLAIVLAILALGPDGWLWPLLKTAIPPIGMIRYPVKYLLLLPILLAVASAASLVWLGRHPTRVAPLMRGGGILLLVLLLAIVLFQRLYPFPFDYWPAFIRNSALRIAMQLGLLGLAAAALLAKFPTPRAWFRAAAIALLVLDGLIHLPNQNPTIPASVLRGVILPAAFPDGGFPKLGEGRAYITPAVEQKLLHSDQKNPSMDFTAKRLALWSHLNLLEAVPKLNGSSTLQLARQKAVEDLIYKKGKATPGLLRLLGVAIASSPDNALEWIPLAQAASLHHTPSTIQPLNTANPLDSFGLDFDPATTLFLDEVDARIATELLPKAPPLPPKVELASWTLNEVTFKVASPDPFALVVAQSWHPAWVPRADGKKLKLLRANHAFQAVIVPGGVGEVRFAYEDFTLKLGAGISLLTLVGLLLPVARKRPAS